MVKKIFKKISRTAKNATSGILWYTRDLARYRKLLQKDGNRMSLLYFPQLFDKDPASHTFDKHYVYMDRWAFKNILMQKPSLHVDVGSSIRFLSMASAATKVQFVDIRPIQVDFDNFECITGSILSMPFADNSVQSLSCLHVAEHIGLGRYGDPLDPWGTKKACEELSRVLAPGGHLYFALPVGREAVYFNAHRVHDPQTILGYFSGLHLAGFSGITDGGHFVEPANPSDFSGASYACGCFHFIKL